MTHQVVIVGGGPGGYVAAIRAAQLGLNPLLIEKEHLGGVCLNWGCIPTKALLRSAEIYHNIQQASQYGIHIDGAVTVDLDTMVQRSRTIAHNLSQGIKGLLKKNNVTVLEGMGTFLDGHTLEVLTPSSERHLISAPHFIVATGARARTLPLITGPHERLWYAKEAMTPPFMPKKLLIVGSGAIGMEFASFYQTIGCAVTVVEMHERILTNEDQEISKIALQNFTQQGIKFHCNTTLSAIDPQKDGVLVTHQDTLTQAHHTPEMYDAVLIAVGIIGNTQGIGLENTNVQVDKGHIVIDAHCETHEKGIYAIGDVAGPPWLAHKASHEGILCVNHIAGAPSHTLNTHLIPGCTYSLPQIASVGLTEQYVVAHTIPHKIGRFNLQANGKALTLTPTGRVNEKGMVKTIFHGETGELLGAHMIGPEVTECIQGFAIAKSLEATEEDLMAMIFPHPTLSEMMHESVLDAYGIVLHS